MMGLTSFFAVAFAAAAAPAKQPPEYVARLQACSGADVAVTAPCTLPTRFSAAAAERLLGAQPHVWWLIGDRLSLIARPGSEGWASLCCAIQTPLMPIPGTELAGITVRIPRVREALFDVGTSDFKNTLPMAVVRGPDAPPAPAIIEVLRGRLIPLELESAILGETRLGTIYVPPNVADGARLPVIYLADGATAQFAPILEAAVRDGRAASSIVVGIDAVRGDAPGCRNVGACDRRMLEYLIDTSPDGPQADTAFGRHLRFVTEELIPYVEANYPASRRREDRITSGYSNGGAWALAAAEARPDLFGGVLAMSSGSTAAAEYAGRLKGTRVFVGAGLFEPGFLEPTMKAAKVARAAGGEVLDRTMVAGHSRTMWDVLFSQGIAWLLPPRR